MTTVLVTGVTGQLGHDVVSEMTRCGYDVLAPNRTEMDVSDEFSIHAYFKSNHVDAVIHCAAWTAVDLAEDEPESCNKVNILGTGYIVKCCKRYDIPLMFFSTDYVFDGNGSEPWKVSDPMAPIGQYGLSKMKAEEIVRTHSKHYIVRISWVFGINGKNFVKTMIRLSETKDSLNVVCDQIGSPTYTVDLAVLIREMIFSGKYGTYHAHNTGYCSWYDFAKAIFARTNAKIKINAVTSDEYPTKAKRPQNSRLDLSSLTENGFDLLPSWEDALDRYLIELDGTSQS